MLLDTHTLLWWFQQAPALSPKARRIIEKTDNEILVSAASAWEIAIKTKAGKLEAGELLEELPQVLDEEGFVELPSRWITRFAPACWLNTTAIPSIAC